MLTVNSVALKDRTCTQCGGDIPKGEQFRMYRERALSSREASHHGMYPERRQCVACMEKCNAVRISHEEVTP